MSERKPSRQALRADRAAAFDAQLQAQLLRDAEAMVKRCLGGQELTPEELPQPPKKSPKRC
jgi:hypothetical protein